MTLGFRTAVVVACTSILLGTVFCNWLVDYGTFWRPNVDASAEKNALEYYQNKVLYSPIWLAYVYAAIVTTAIGSLISKMLSFRTSSLLFDGASLVLYAACLTSLSASIREDFPTIRNAESFTSHVTLDTLKRIASTSLFICICLTGVIALEAGQYFSENSSEDQVETPTEAAAKSKLQTPASSPVKSRRSTPKSATPNGNTASDKADTPPTQAPRDVAAVKIIEAADPTEYANKRITRSKSAAVIKPTGVDAPAVPSDAESTASARPPTTPGRKRRTKKQT